MASDALEAARWRYAAAFAAYTRASKHIAKMLADGPPPSAEEVRKEAKALEELVCRPGANFST